MPGTPVVGPIDAPAVVGQTSGVQPVSAYVQKVKSLVNGGLVTTGEVTTVARDPSMLKGLVDGWMTGPGFERQMLAFFTTYLQQGDFTTAQMRQQHPRYPGFGPWNANIVEMMPRTALRMVLEDSPFNEIAMTTRFEVTTALLVLLRYLDLDVAAGKKGRFGCTTKGYPKGLKRQRLLRMRSPMAFSNCPTPSGPP